MSSSRPSRTTRSSTNGNAPPVPPLPSTSRTRKPSFKMSLDPPSTSSSSTSARPSSGIPTSSTSKISAPKPLWNSSRFNSSPSVVDPSGTPKRSSSNIGAAAGAATPGIPRFVGNSGAQAAGQTPRSRTTSTVGSSGLPDLDEGRVVNSHSSTFEKRGVDGYDPAREPIQAYLRLRPPPNPAQAKTSYIEILNDTEVLMVPPPDHRLNPSTSTIFGVPLLPRPSSAASLDPPTSPTLPSSFTSLYKFTRVFPSFPSPSQSDFFKATTLPLVKDFLGGENCLLFAYGPTGSGKTWTVQGGEGENAGLLPRVMDVVWRSLEGKEGRSAAMRPVKLSGFEPQPTMSTPQKGKPFAAPGLGMRASNLGVSSTPTVPSKDLPDIIQVDDRFEYSIWVSYAEIYNEKIYDLLEAPLPTPSMSTSSTASHSHGMLGLFSAGGAKAKAMVKGFTTVKRNPLSLKQDKTVAGGGSGTKYVAGMKEVRVHSAEEARMILDRGQQNRRVFSTLANRVSSRSHSVFTIKVIRVLKGADVEDLSATSTSRFSIVDLAGSERVVNTQTTGERLKEAGNINKSLMVLGQCMEVLRRNQEKEKGKKPAIVPFRHSKLTELFQSFFVGDGKAAMIVNVNPYDTGFDENSHVMKFSAVAKGVMTTKDSTPVPVLTIPVKVKEPPRVVRVSMIEGGEEEDVIYEEEEEVDDDDNEEDELVNALMEELSATRIALFEAQMAAALAASQARMQIVNEYEAKLTEMEEHYRERLNLEAIEAEEKMNAKLAILNQLHEANAQSGVSYDDSDDDAEDGEEEEDAENTEEKVEELLLHGQSFVEVQGSPSASSVSEEPSPVILAALRTHARVASPDPHDSPIPAPKTAAPMLLDDGELSLRSGNTNLESEVELDTPSASEREIAAAVTNGKKVATAKKSTVKKGKAVEVGPIDDLAFEFDQSIIIPAEGKLVKSKSKRKLGDIKVKDTDVLDELYAPSMPAKTPSSRSLAGKAASNATAGRAFFS